MEDNSILKVKNISKTYKNKRGQRTTAVDNISFEVKKGEILGFLGANGAGKTTTIKMICGLITPDNGEITIKGIDNRKNRNKVMEKISAVLEGNRNIYWRLTVKENIEFFSAIKGLNTKEIKSRMEHYIRLFDLTEKKNTQARMLSRGMQQKLAIAMTLVNNSEIVLLDEPTLGLDVNTSYEIRGLLKRIAKEEGKTIIITTHDMNVVEDICERVIIIDNGQIIVEDEVNKLMELFNMKCYEIKIKGLLTETQQKELLKIPSLRIRDDISTVITIDTNKKKLLYKIMDVLKSENTIIADINSKNINFEKVFINLTRRDKNEKASTM